MHSSYNCLLSCVILILYSSKTCSVDIPAPPSLVIRMAGEPEYTDVLVQRIGDNMTLICELQGDTTPRHFVWNYLPAGNYTDRSYTEVSTGSSSTLTRTSLTAAHSGHYMCSAPPFSTTKYIVVQGQGPKYCGLGQFWCELRCVPPQYVCDGRADCVRAEDELPAMCSANICARADKLNCSTGRCISESACCRAGARSCQQPSCCDEYPRFSRLEGFVDMEYPSLFEDRHAPDDYGFIQSTIYTVTACALIFMIAVVLLVSAICKMHMKRAALRSYAHADRQTRQHYSLQYAQTHRFPPCYEASRLLEQEARAPDATQPAALQCGSECPPETATDTTPDNSGFGLARLSAIFSSRYRQVPTQSDVELTNVRSTSLNNSPTRNRTLDNYRSPTYCDLNASEFYFTNPETGDFGRDLNFMDTSYQNRNSNGTLERVIEQLDRQRLTLQLGRFQLTIPRFGRRSETPRPDTPNVAEINIDDLDFVRTSHDTYTLNGRTIRLLGANFENYPVLPDGSRPPPYNEAMRSKFFGPPPEYLSREGLNSRADEEARNNVEMPPCYDELNGDNGNTGEASNNNSRSGNTGEASNSNNGRLNNENIDTSNITGIDTNITVITDVNTSINNSDIRNHPSTSNMNTNIISEENNVISSVRDVSMSEANNNNVIATSNTSTSCESNGNLPNESISSIINNLPAIDSDLNANDAVVNC